MPLKRIAKANWLIHVLVYLIAGFLRFVRLTSRIEEVDPQFLDDTIRRHGGVIFAFWHGRVAMMPFTVRAAMALRVLASRNRDGEIIAGIVGRLGVPSIRGSSKDERKNKDKGGAAALREMVAVLRDGKQIGVTPDGPRGPRMRVSDGVVTLARLSGAPIVPVASATSRRWIFNSWDRLQLPLPFSTTVFVFGAPIYVSRDEVEIEAARHNIETQMNKLSQRADEYVGQKFIEPASEAL